MTRARIFLFALLMFPANGIAFEQSANLGGFLKSVTSLYVTSEECKYIAYLHSENYSSIIKEYLTHYYGDAIPYWALPEVRVKITSRQQCIESLQENLMVYSTFSTQFADNFPDQPPPPNLPDLYITQTYTPQYKVTAPVITK